MCAIKGRCSLILSFRDNCLLDVFMDQHNRALLKRRPQHRLTIKVTRWRVVKSWPEDRKSRSISETRTANARPNKNANGPIRQYRPKSIDFDIFSQKELDKIAKLSAGVNAKALISNALEAYQAEIQISLLNFRIECASLKKFFCDMVVCNKTHGNSP